MKLPELPKKNRVQTHGYNTTTAYTAQQLRAYGKACAEAMREACAAECEARYMGDNKREDMEARRCAEAIRSLEIEE